MKYCVQILDENNRIIAREEFVIEKNVSEISKEFVVRKALVYLKEEFLFKIFNFKKI